MSAAPSYEIQRLSGTDVALMESLLTMFGQEFDEIDTYGSRRPSTHYLEKLLASRTFIALAALKSGAVIGGLAAYVLPKFEQQRSEIYAYDLAVAAGHRRQGVATALIKELKLIGKAIGAYVILIQADRDNPAAIHLYETLGKREDIVHFDIPID